MTTLTLEYYKKKAISLPQKIQTDGYQKTQSKI